jgi:hypothetical protein
MCSGEKTGSIDPYRFTIAADTEVVAMDQPRLLIGFGIASAAAFAGDGSHTRIIDDPTIVFP